METLVAGVLPEGNGLTGHRLTGPVLNGPARGVCTMFGNSNNQQRPAVGRHEVLLKKLPKETAPWLSSLWRFIVKHHVRTGKALP